MVTFGQPEAVRCCYFRRCAFRRADQAGRIFPLFLQDRRDVMFLFELEDDRRNMRSVFGQRDLGPR